MERQQTSDPRVFSVRGALALGNYVVDGALVVLDGSISEVRRGPQIGVLPEPVVGADIVSPGFIDLQVNGGFGVEVDAAESIRLLSRRLPEAGVTAWLPTVITSPPEWYGAVFTALTEARDSAGAVPLGLHLEGPFLSTMRCGAHRRDLIETATWDQLDALITGDVRLVTLAPERPGALAQIARLRDLGIAVSLGHTDARYEQFEQGVDAGAAMATHLFNAMSPFTHRAPNVIGAALLDDRITAGLIADGIHSHRASLELAYRVKGPDRIALVSDLMSAAGMPSGVYSLGGREVRTDGHSVSLPDGTLAGSVTALDQCVRNMVAWTGASPAAALRMATEVPARLLRLTHKGRLVPGADADLVLLDAALKVQSTYVRGQCVHHRGGSWPEGEDA